MQSWAEMEQTVPCGFAPSLDGGFGPCCEGCHKHNVRSVICFSLGEGWVWSSYSRARALTRGAICSSPKAFWRSPFHPAAKGNNKTQKPNPETVWKMKFLFSRELPCFFSFSLTKAVYFGNGEFEKPRWEDAVSITREVVRRWHASGKGGCITRSKRDTAMSGLSSFRVIESSRTLGTTRVCENTGTTCSSLQSRNTTGRTSYIYLKTEGT